MKLYHIYIFISVFFLILYIILTFLGFREGFVAPPQLSPTTSSSAITEPSAMKLPPALVTALATTKLTDNSLLQYSIKASYNSAFSGSYLSLDALKYVIGRGCRFLDFEVFIDSSGGSSPSAPAIAVVGYTTDATFQRMECNNTLPLDTVFKYCITNAFSAGIAPNFGDPLFIHIRAKTALPLDPIANSIKATLLQRLYMDGAFAKPVSQNTLLQDIMGKIVLVFDSTVKLGSLTNSPLNSLINLSSGTGTLHKYTYNDIDSMQKTPPTVLGGNNTTTDVSRWSLVVPPTIPTSQIAVPSVPSMIGQKGIQIVAIPFYLGKNPAITQYEYGFNQYNGGIVPFGYFVNYWQTTQTTAAKPVTLSP